MIFGYYKNYEAAGPGGSDIDTLTTVANWIFLIGYVIVTAASIGILTLVLSKPQSRNDWFLVAITLFLFLTGILNCTGLMMTFYHV